MHTGELDPPRTNSIDAVLQTPYREFFSRYSDLEVDGFPTFSTPSDVMFGTNEIGYPSSLPHIGVSGGIHLAVAGGLDPAFGQIGVAHPELTIMCDVNPFMVKVMDIKLALLGEASSGAEYWDLLPKRLGDSGFPITSNLRYGIFEPRIKDGWSTKYYEAVQSAWNEGRIKFFLADMVSHGISTGFEIARETGLPITLIYVSNIFDARIFNSQSRFKNRLAEGIEEGVIAEDAQIVDARALHTDVFQVTKYAEPLVIADRGSIPVSLLKD